MTHRGDAIRAIALMTLITACRENDTASGKSTSDAGRTSDAADGGNTSLRPGEIGADAPLLNSDGTVATRAWARHPYMQYDRDLVDPAQIDSLREWEYYAIHTEEFSVTLTVTDIGVTSAAIPTLEDFATGTIHSAFLLGTEGVVDFPSSPFADTVFDTGAASVRIGYDDEQRTIDVSTSTYEAHLVLDDPREAESISVIHTFSEPGQFFYENKRLPMAASGWVRVNGLDYELGVGDAFGVLDWGRGVWPTNVRWEWAHFTGKAGDHEVGVNLGQIFDAESDGSADAILVDGVLNKADRVSWTYDVQDVMAPWRFASAADGVDLTLTPELNDSTTMTLGPAYTLTRSKVHGVLTGTARLEDGTDLVVDGLRGAAEYVEIAW